MLRRGALGRCVTALAAVAAILLNGIVVQSHVDLGAFQLGATVSLASTAATPDGEGGAPKVVCAVCQVAASTGGMVLSAASAPVVAAAALLPAFALGDRSVATIRPSHDWRSRAPPFLA